MANFCVACGTILPEQEMSDTCSYECFEKAYCHFPSPLEFEPLVIEEVPVLAHA